jgi:thiamine pyrophosphokinase
MHRGFFNKGMKAYIFANGDFPHPNFVQQMIHDDDLLIAADAGYYHIRQIGLVPTIVIGDLDSILAEDQDLLLAEKIPTIKHPVNKDETDLDLCLRYALEMDVEEIIVTGAFGGRVDQTLGNMMILDDPKFIGRKVKLEDGITEAFFIDQGREIVGKPGDTISLIPWGVPVTGITTIGLQYPLNVETLFPNQSRGISNRMITNLCTIEFDQGTLFCVHIRNEREE